MRDATLSALRVTSVSAVKPGPQLRSAHAGLYFERCAPVGLEVGAGRGRVEHDDRDAFLDRVVSITVPPLYRSAYARWFASLAEGGAFACEVRAASRLLVGHGNPSGVEVGITLHPTYGVPYIPGSALKGMLNHYIADLGGALPGEEGERWRGVKYDEVSGAPIGRPGSFHGALFGAPKLSPGGDDPDDAQDGLRGGVVFEDAWYVPDSIPDGRTLVRDVLTPHQFTYYSKLGEKAPTDWDSPVPVSFLTVRPNARFLIAVSARHEGAGRLAIQHLLDALRRRGVGGKTRAGYGRLERYGSLRLLDPESPAPAGAATAADARQQGRSTTITALEDAVKRILEPPKEPTPLPIVQRFETELGDDRLFATLERKERGVALRVMEPIFKHAGLLKRCGERIKMLRTRLTGI